MEPEDFCKLILSFSEVDSSGSNYDDNCLKILAIALKVSRKTMYGWGNPPKFDKFPERYKRELQLIAIIEKAEHEMVLLGLDRATFQAALVSGSTNLPT